MIDETGQVESLSPDWKKKNYMTSRRKSKRGK
jgi:hypothetical protein